MKSRDSWLILPLVGNVILAAACLFAGRISFPHDPWGCYLAAAVACLLCCSSVVGFVVHDIGPLKAFLALVAQCLCLIMIFTLIYFLAPAFAAPVHFMDTLYYSLATLVGKGYLMLTPLPEMRILTVMEGITGYLYLALLISIMTNAVRQAGIHEEDLAR